MSKTPRPRRLLSAAVCLAATFVPAHAGGFRLPDQDAFATARGEAFAATADNPSAVYYNPAGITQLEGHQARFGVYGIDLGVSYTSPAGKKYDNSKDLHAVPQIFYTFTPEKSPVSFGFGAYSPYGLSSEWPEDTGFRSVVLGGKLTYLTLNPVVAWQITPTLSVGGGAMINYAEADLRSGLSPFPGVGQSRLNGSGWAPGFNAGILWKPCEKVQIGLNYRSESRIPLDGYLDIASPVFSAHPDAKAELPFPQTFVAGISYRPTPDWNLEFDIEWNDWNRLNSMSVHAPQAPFLDSAIAFNWQSSFYYEFGATRYLGGGWSVSAGYIFNENSVPDHDFTPLVTDLDRHFVSFGGGYKHGRLSVDLAYQLGYGPTRTVTGNPVNSFGQSTNGEYDFLSHALLLSMGWHF